MTAEPKNCQCCGKPLQRKYYGLRLEDITAFKKRRFCSMSCANTHKPQSVEAKRKAVKDQPASKNPPPLPDKKIMPLEYLLRIMNDRNEKPSRRDRAAIAALPYCHGKLAPVRKAEDNAKKSASRFSPTEAPNLYQFPNKKH
jgi:hypothetical protein